MAKKFKLVYDQKGDIKGSYTGIPGEKDPVLIERAVLDGEKAPDPKPAGEKKITKNGKYDVSKFASAEVKVEGVKPAGTLDINENGQYDVFNKANVDVNVPQGVFPEGTKEIKNNGEFDVKEFEKVSVDVPGATTKDLFEATENGEYDIAEYARVSVDVPNPSSGILEIAENGEYDVTEKAGVNVAVPQPSGKAPAIVANGTNIDIKDYETVDVNVPNPSTGTLEITENGEYNVTEKAAVDVRIPEPEYDSTKLYCIDSSNELNSVDLPSYEDDSNYFYDANNAEYKVFKGTNACVPSGWHSDIYENGTYEVAGYAYVDVRIDSPMPTSAGVYYYSGTGTSFKSMDMREGHTYRYDGRGDIEELD